LMGSTVKVTLEIEAEIQGGAPENVVRTVIENSLIPICNIWRGLFKVPSDSSSHYYAAHVISTNICCNRMLYPLHRGREPCRTASA
jgi:hypothetical protein